MGWGSRSTLKEGQTAPEVQLRRMDGSSVPLKELIAERPVLLAFYKASCPTCQLTLPYLDRLDGDGVRVVAVSQDSAAVASQFSKEFGIGYETLIDPAESGYKASNEFGLTHVPSLFLVQQDGRISWVSEGFVKVDMEELASSLGRTMFTETDVVPAAKPG